MIETEQQEQETQEQQTPQERILELARECFEKTGSSAKAVDRMEKLVRTKFPKLAEAMIRSGCSVAVGQVITAARYRIWNAPDWIAPDPEVHARRIRAVAEGNERRLMELPLPGGKILGKANREELEEAAESFISQGSTMLNEGEFIRLVASKVVDDKLAEDCWTEEQLQQVHPQFKGKKYV